MKHVTASVVFLLLLACATSSAQTAGATTGAINGRIVDSSGAVLPGVTVTIESPQMQGTPVAVSNTEGHYRFPAIPPGTFKITCELAGFATLVRTGIRVTLGFTATVNVTMEVAGLAESITVSGDSPVVDMVSTRTSTNFDFRELASIPSARDLWAILAESPAIHMGSIDVGGSAAGTQSGYRGYDAQGGQNRVMIDGLVTTEGTGASGVYVDYGAFEEVTVSVAGHGAEMGWPGVQTQMMIKSGGNAYHGSVYADYENEALQSTNVTDEQMTRGAGDKNVNRLHAYRDFDADGGGYIARDRVWWYMSFRDFNTEVRQPTFPVVPLQTALRHFSPKGTFSLPGNNRLIASAMVTRKHQPIRLLSARAGGVVFTDEDQTGTQRHWAWVFKGEWNRVLSDAAFVEVRSGQFGYNWPVEPNESADPNGWRVEDLTDSWVRGPNRDWQQNRRRNQVLASLSWFKDGWVGDHNFKLGGEVFHETWTEEWKEGAYGHSVVSYLRTGQPFEVDLLETPNRSEAGLMTYSAYANDVWRVTDKLTLTPGLRFDRYRNYRPAQEHAAGPFNPVAVSFAAEDEVMAWNLVSPRFGATYDLAGDGKTVLKFNYGQYWWNPGVMTGANPNQSLWYKRYRWADLNGNGHWDPGEEGTLIGTSGGEAQEGIDSGLDDTYTRELSLWLERELAGNFGLRTGFVYRAVRDRYDRWDTARPWDAFNVPVQLEDPGPDGRLGTADDTGLIIDAFNVDPAYVGLPSVNMVQNQRHSKGDFYTWEISATRRMSRRWSLRASFAHAWNRQPWLPRNPNHLINTDSPTGERHFTSWNAKVIMAFEAPYGININPLLRHQSGDLMARNVLFRMNYGSELIYVEKWSTNRFDHTTLLDLRAEKMFRFAGDRRVTGFVDVYNIFNSNAEFRQNYRSGGNFLNPTVILAPRVLRIGAKLDW